ncbi:MAG TPA: HNH endonuclease [Acidimicrobiia bacterium]
MRILNRRPLDIHLRLGVLRRDGFRCSHCGFVGDIRQLEVDHVRPLARGGTDSPDNLQTLCRRCNRRKGARFIG